MVETILGGENMKKEKYVPEISSRLRKRSVSVPNTIYNASGIKSSREEN